MKKRILSVLLFGYVCIAEAVSTGCKKLRTLPKKVMAVCIAAAIVVAMVPVAVFAAETTYDVWVGGVQITSEKLSIEGDSGTATYVPATNTLTLNNFSYTGQGYVYDSTWCAAIFSKNDLTVEVVGSNTVTASVTGDYTAEALNVWGALTITGDSGSSLTLTGAGSPGVESGGNLSIENVTVNATGLSGLISWEGSITINNAEVTATATADPTEDAAAIYAYEGNITIENSTVTANAPHTNAVDSFKSELCYTIKNSNVTISAAEYGIGLTVGTRLFVENSTVEVTSDAGLAIVNDQVPSGAVPSFTGTHVVYAGANKASATEADASENATYANKYVKIVPIQTYDLWVGGVQVTSKNKDILIQAINDANNETVASGGISYDPATNTLTLNNFSYTGKGYGSDYSIYEGDIAAVIYSDDALNILLEGDSVITHVNSDYYAISCGIASPMAITIADAPANGIGTLTVTGGTDCTTSAGLFSLDNVTIAGGIVTATGDDAFYTSAGILSYWKNITISGGVVTACGQKSGTYSAGLIALWDITISGATVNATAGDAVDESVGIFAYQGAVTISDSTVTATGTGDDSAGIAAYGDITISGDTVEATGTYYGIASLNGDITINGENTFVNATSIGDGGSGIMAYGDITISGGTVTASGHESGIYGDSITIEAGATVIAEYTTTGDDYYGAFAETPTLNGTFIVYAGTADANEPADASADATYANKYVKIVPIQTYDVYYNLNLGSDIDFRFLIKQEDLPDHTGLTATITHIRDEANGFANKTITAMWATYEADDVTYWQLRYNGVAAKEMTDDLVLKITDAEGNVVLEHTSSVKTYAEDRIANSPDEKTVALMKALLGYGGTAQENFDYKADAPAGAALNYGGLVDGAGNGLTSGSGNVNIYYNLNLGSDIDFRFLIKQDDLDNTGLKATITHVRDEVNEFADKTVNVEWGTYTSGGVTYWMLRYNGIAAKEMTDNLVLTITDAEGNIVVQKTSSVLAYAVDRIENSTNAKTVDLMKALLGYGAAAQTDLNYKINNLADSVLTK